MLKIFKKNIVKKKETQKLNNYFIIHGFLGFSNEGWLKWLEEYLNSRGQEVYNFDYPTPKNQTFENWSKILKEKLNKINQNSTFICCDIGCVFLVKFCLENNIQIKKVIFVSGYNNVVRDKFFYAINHKMYINNLKEFIKFCPERICIFSINDNIVPFKYLKQFAKTLKAKEVVYSNAGHFTIKDGYQEFYDILEFIDV